MFVSMLFVFATLFSVSKMMALNVRNFSVDIYKPDLFFNAANTDNVILFVSSLLFKALITFFMILLPILVVAFIAGLIGNLAQIGFLFTFEPLSPKFNKINPVSGFKKIFSKKTVVELFKNILKIGLIGYLVYLTIKSSMLFFINCPRGIDFIPLLIEAKKIIEKLVWQVIGAFVLLAAFDFYVQRAFFMKDMRMSLKELKDEYKNQEGDPHIKGKGRQMARQLAMGGGISRVADASAVVPILYICCAIKYDTEL